jgi:hypothetical protein
MHLLTQRGLRWLLKDTLLFYKDLEVVHVSPEHLTITVRLHWLSALTLGLYRYFTKRKVKKLFSHWADAVVEVE